MNTPPNNAEVANRFASVARDFCGAIDAAASVDRTELLVRVYRILPKLISEAVGLPNLEFNDDENEEDEGVISQARKNLRLSDAQWSQLYESLKVKLGDLHLYWKVLDPTKDTEAIRGSLADDFADIYRDLKEELDLTEAHKAVPEEHIWHWQLGYYTHWGKHAIDALGTIHLLLEEFLSDEILG